MSLEHYSHISKVFRTLDESRKITTRTKEELKEMFFETGSRMNIDDIELILAYKYAQYDLIYWRENYDKTIDYLRNELTRYLDRSFGRLIQPEIEKHIDSIQMLIEDEF